MKTINVGIVGLGRLGQKHAQNLAFKTKGAKLIAACSLDNQQLQYAKKELAVPNCYQSYQQLLANEEIDTVFLASSTAVHAEQTIQALQAGKHVFCEKPLAPNVADCKKVEAIAAKHPKQVLMVGFMRRYDPAYRRAKQKIQDNAIGQAFMLYSQTADLDETAEFQIQFSKVSGGMFLDMSIHDIDLAHWLLDSQIIKVCSAGDAYVYEGFKDFNDADNTVVLAYLANGSMAVIHGSRTAFHGHHTHSLIKGTEGELSIGSLPAIDDLNVFDKNGIRTECMRSFYERFEQAFQNQTQAFIDAIILGQKIDITPAEATLATKVALACRRSFEQKCTVMVADIKD